MTNQDHHQIEPNRGPVETVASAIKGFISKGYIREPWDLSPSTILLNLDADTAECVLSDAIEKALQLLDKNGIIVDSGEKLECCSCGALETAWVVSEAHVARHQNLH